MKNNNFKRCQIRLIKRKLKKGFKHSQFSYKLFKNNFEFPIFIILLISKLNEQNIKLVVKTNNDLSFQFKYYECINELKEINNIKDNLAKIDSIVTLYANMISEAIIKNFLNINKSDTLFLIQQLFKFAILYFYYDKNIIKFNINPNENLNNANQYNDNVKLNILKINALKEIKKIIMILFPVDFNNLMVYLMQYSKKHY